MQTERPDFARVYEMYRHSVRAYAARLIGEEDADDVAQEVFVKVQRALDTLEDPARLSAWIHVVTLNAVRDAAPGPRPSPRSPRRSRECGRTPAA